jgi:hypothetical protein
MLRRLAWLLLLLAAASALLWGASPWYLPAVARSQLPAGWTLEQLDARRPGLGDTHIRQAKLSGPLAGLRLDIHLAGARIEHWAPAIHIESLDISLHSSGQPAQPFRLEDLSVPPLLLPAGTLPISIERLLVDGLGLAEPLELRGLALDSTGHEVLQVEASSAPLPGLGVGVNLVLEAGPGGLQAELADPAGALTLMFSQSLRETIYLSRLELAVQPQRLELPALNTWLAAQQWPTLGGDSGRLQLNASFSGPARQLLDTFSLSAQQLQLAASGLDIAVDLQAQGHIQAGQLLMTATRDGQLNVSGLPDAWPRELRDGMLSTLSALGVDLDASNGEVINASITLQQGATLQGDGAGLFPLSLSGPATLQAAQLPGRQLSLAWPRLELQLPDATLANLELQGEVNWALTHQPRLRYLAGAQAADIDGLESAGVATLAAQGWQLSGRAEGTRLLVSEPGDANEAAMLGGDNWWLQAELRQSATGLLSHGNGELRQSKLPGLGMNAAALSFNWQELDMDSLTGQVGLGTQGLNLALDGLHTSGLESRLQGVLSKGERVNGTGALLFGSGAELPYAFQANLAAGTANIELVPGSLAASQLAALFTALGAALPEGLALTAGTVSYSGKLTVSEQNNGSLRADGEGLAASIVNSQVSGMRFQLDAGLGDTISADASVFIEQAELAAGLDMHNLALELQLDDALTIRNLEARFFDGLLRLVEARVAGGKLQPTVLFWQDLDLGQLLRFMDVGGLSGSGRLDATLPILGKGDGIAVRAGHFTSLGPGTLVYNSGAPATNIGLQALENFQYDELSGSMDYDPAGPYAISMVLLGRNPELYSGYPIRFRLTLGGELPALFKSLFLTGSFEEALLQQVSSGQQDPSP